LEEGSMTGSLKPSLQHTASGRLKEPVLALAFGI